MSLRDLRLESSIVVPHRLEDVWDFLSDPMNSNKWDRSVASIEATSGDPVGIGWRGTTTAPSGARQEFRIDLWEPSRRFGFELLESTMFERARLRFTLEHEGSGVRIEHLLELSVRNVLLVPILRATAKRALATDLRSLRDRLAVEYPTS